MYLAIEIDISAGEDVAVLRSSVGSIACEISTFLYSFHILHRANRAQSGMNMEMYQRRILPVRIAVLVLRTRQSCVKMSLWSLSGRVLFCQAALLFTNAICIIHAFYAHVDNT